MKNDLPGVYANKISKKINNTQDLYYDENKSIDLRNDKKSISKKISDIFNSLDHVYKSDVKITINDRSFIKTIVGKKNNYLLTMDNESININDISNIEKI